MSRTTVIISDSSEMNSESTLCRLCIKNNDSCFSIFTSNVTCEMPVKDVLQDLVGLQVALGDGLPGVICPLCLKKLMEFRDFKRICFESDAELRKCPSRNCFKSIKEERTADDNMGWSAETKECIPDTIEGTAQFTCSVQRTEIYIPLENCQLPTANIMCTVKEENEQLFSGGNYPAFNLPNTAGISSEASDPLATDDLPTFTKDGKPIGNCKMTNVSTMEATGLSSPDKMMMERTSTSCMMKEKVVRIGNSDDCIAPSVSVTHIQSQTVSSHGEEGSNVRDEDLEEGSAPHALKILSNSIPDDGQSYMRRSSDGNGKPHTLNMSSKSTSCARNLRNHTLGGTKRGPFNCNASFSQGSSLSNHTRAHKERKCYQCRICSKSFTTKSDLAQHMQIHTGEKTYSRNECTESFPTKDSFILHIETHTKETPYTCNICSKNFAQCSSLHTHMCTRPDSKPFSCDDCSKSFSRKSGLVKHLRTHNTGERPYACNYCAKSFTRNDSFTKHLRVHTGEKPYSCSDCAKSFSTRDSLILHLHTHAEVKPFSCNDCTKSFSRKRDLVIHLRTHTGERPYSCKHCAKSFNQSGHLNQHVRTHTGEKPHSCNYCAKSFSRKDHLVLHLLTHTGEKRYSCNICAKSFSQNSTLHKHMRVHSGEKPHCCTFCAKSFTKKVSLIKHTRTHLVEKL
ncbi:zinc finger protein 271-like isoform X2 [Ischnura elegans]|uniref:zinc finger protein 271-like isoform X2 n=1 Tax=Ischnura elegans TaxID=197161 RepID=UPI001ED88F1F|nr:zinc finger protein 271-like isoform X2 [Ischnura elegans]